MGISQHVHGTDNSRCLIALALVTGQIGRPGTGLHPLRGQNNVQGASDAGLIPMVYPDYQRSRARRSGRSSRSSGAAELDPVRGLTVVEIMNAIHAGKIQGMYIEGENPAMSDPDLNHAREALAKLEHLVVQDLFLTETAFHADVVLPASAFAEKSGTFTNTDRRVQLARPVIKPPGDARQDWWIIQEIAPPASACDGATGAARDLRRDGGQAMPSFANITWERLEREGAVTYPVDAPDKPGNEIIFYAGFPTDERARPDRAGQCHAARRAARRRLPDGALDRARAGALAHRLDDPARRACWTRSSRRRSRSCRRAICGACGSSPATFIRLETRRGAVEVKVRTDRDVPEGMVFMPFCYAEAAANLLTNPALDPFGKIPEFKFCAARVTAQQAVAAE